MSYNMISNKLETCIVFTKKFFLHTNFWWGEDPQRRRTSCFCISQSINPKHLYFSSQSALGSLHQTSRWETSSETHLTPWLKASTGWSHKSWSPQNSPAHSTSFRNAALQPAHVPPAVTPLHSQSCCIVLLLWSHAQRRWSEKRADCHNTAIIPGKGREWSLPWCPVGRRGGGSTWSRTADNTPAGRGSSPPSLWAEKRHHWIIP